MFKKFLLFAIIISLFSSCTLQNHKKLRISITNWIGYTPLFYAKEKGWLELLDVKLLNVVSLSENMYLYKSGNSDAYVGTQYEYNTLVKNIESIFNSYLRVIFTVLNDTIFDELVSTGIEYERLISLNILEMF